MGDLPESCIMEVMLHLNPPEICLLARLSQAFREAASGDPVWDAKLLASYRKLVEMAGELKDWSLGLSKKEVYAQLARPNTFDGGTKEFWLEKSTVF